MISSIIPFLVIYFSLIHFGYLIFCSVCHDITKEQGQTILNEEEYRFVTND